MNCQEMRERMMERFEAGYREGGQEHDDVREHLAGCAECRSEWEQDAQAWAKLRPVERIVASHQLRERTMTAITMEAERERGRAARWTWTWRAWPRWALAACAAVLLVALMPMLPLGKGNSNAAGIALLAQSVEAMQQVQSVHIVGRMRTLPGDNFELIGTDYKFVPLEMWHQFGTPERWRVEKPGRVVVMDGAQSVLYMPEHREAMKAGPTAGFVEWLRPLLNPETVLANELEAARQGKAQAKLTEANGVITLVITRKAQGDFTNDWLKNKAIDYADHMRVYRFDAATKRLAALEVVVHTPGEDFSVLELTRFIYNETLAPSLFALELPPDVKWLVDGNAMPATAANLANAREAASFFFNALAREDWTAVKQVLPMTDVPDRLKKQYGGLKVVSVGEAFRSGQYPGWFVPYEVRLRNGENKHFKLAVRNDNPQKRWMVDGGF